MADRDEAADRLRARLEGLQPVVGSNRGEPSDLRRRIRDSFDAMTAARGRGVSWQQIADAMSDADADTQGSEGAELDWRRLKSLYHAERYARGGKRKRRRPTGSPKARAPSPAQQAPEPARPEPGNAAADPASPYAAVDQQRDAKRARRQRTARFTAESFFEPPEAETE